MTEGRHPVKATPMRVAIARRMIQSKQQVPHFYVSTEIALAAAADRHNSDRANADRVTLPA